MKKVKKIHKAEYRPIDDLITYSPMPTKTLSYIDPFLFLNHHGPQVYPPNNNGLPFGPHPHRGMETVTIILDGDISHKDSGGHESIIGAGGIQWMTAGSGLIHAETSSSNFMKTGGNLEILQLWLNLPAKHKMDAPFYSGKQEEEIQLIQISEGVKMSLISGNIDNFVGAFTNVTNTFLSVINAEKGSSLQLDVSPSRNIFFYMIKGKLLVNEIKAQKLELVEFSNEGENIKVYTEEDATILFGHSLPLNEPIVAQGPFVMNTEEEIAKAYRDYRSGKFGTWNA